MTFEYQICDRCGANIPHRTGALVLRANTPNMNLCEKCFHEFFPNGAITEDKAKEVINERK